MKNKFSDRKYVVGGLFVLIGVILVARLFFLQIISDDFYDQAIRNTRKQVIDYPARGIILDRNKKVLVHNELAYDLMVIPRELKGVDTIEICSVLELDTADFNKKINRIVKRNGNTRTEDVFMELITGRDFVRIKEQMYKLKGFRVRSRTVRSYPNKSASHVLGYLGEVNKKDIDKDKYYKPGDYFGKSGLEKYYENILRGEKGVKYILKDVYSNVQGQFEDGEYDIPSVPGVNIVSSIDLDLQLYGEKLMKNKRGSIIAIDPKTGEVLCMISAPDYDPSMLVGRKYGKNYGKIARNKNKLFFNRSIQAFYPPGSIFKTLQAGIAQQMGVANVNTTYGCNKKLVGCHNHENPLNLPQSVMHSCNPYYYHLYNSMITQNRSKNIFEDARIGYNNWREYTTSFGLGTKLGVDLPYEKNGQVPAADYYDRYYAKRWTFRTIYSLAIGQGELLVVPLQMANLAATMANKGYYYTPHMVKDFEGDLTPEFKDSLIGKYKEKHITKVEPQYFDLIHDGMQWVVERQGGTASKARIPGITVCGKTGTAQNPHGEDHSVFICFAPREDPKIAVAVYVENAGGGGSWAAPIASLIVEQYLTDSISRFETEKRILEANLMDVQVEE